MKELGRLSVSVSSLTWPLLQFTGQRMSLNSLWCTYNMAEKFKVSYTFH